MEAVFDDNQAGTVKGNDGLGGKLQKRDAVGCVTRKKLADITNLSMQPKQATEAAKTTAVLLQKKELIERLRKENVVLTRALGDRDKIIEVGQTELQKLRNDLQKLQEKNLQLAKANTQMLMELNSGKEKLSLLRHELDCKNCLLKVRQFELEEKAKSGACHFNASEPRDETIKRDDAGESSQADQPCTTRRRPQKKKQSLSFNSAEPIQAEEDVNKKRQCRRRQSTRFSSECAESGADALETGYSKCDVLNETEVRTCGLLNEGDVSKSDIPNVKEDYKCNVLNDTEDNKRDVASRNIEPLEKCSTPSSLSAETEYGEKYTAASKLDDRALPRSSLGRPSRRATEKVQSYKEIPINVKMRR